MSWGGLSGLIAHIRDTILIDKPELNDDVINEIVSKYPLSKSSLKYLFTLYDEMISQVVELQSQINSLEVQIKRFESKKGVVKGVDIEDLQNELRELRNRLSELEKDKKALELKRDELEKDKRTLELERDELEEQLQALELELHNCRSFFDSNSFCAMLYRNYLRKVSG